MADSNEVVIALYHFLLYFALGACIWYDGEYVEREHYNHFIEIDPKINKSSNVPWVFI